MTTTVRANGSAFRQRLTDAGLSERELVRRTGLGPASVRSILFRGSVSGAVTMADIKKCLDEVGMTWGDLFDSPVLSASDETPDADVATLGGLLNGADRATTADRLCRALGWEPDRLTRAGNRLDEQLRALGQRLVRNANGYAIRPLGLGTNDALQRLNAIRDDEVGMHSGMARVMYQVYNGTMSKRETKNDQQVQVAALLNRGAIRASDATTERWVLSEEVKYALDF